MWIHKFIGPKFSRTTIRNFWVTRCLPFLERCRGLDFSSPETNPAMTGVDPTLSFVSWPSGNYCLRRVFDKMDITEMDNILDIGCGKGSAMKLMLDFPFKRVDGIEISPYLGKIAEANFRKLGVKNVCVYISDAIQFNAYNQYSHIYFFNPFPAIIMIPVLKKIMESMAQNPRKLVIIYSNPLCHNEVLMITGFKVIMDMPDMFGKRIFVYTNS